jgi:hypothetical protein
MKKKTGGGGSDSTAYNKKKIDGSLKIMMARDTTTPVGKQAFNSLTKGMEGLARAENKKAGVVVNQPKKDFSHGSPYRTKAKGYDYPSTGLKINSKKK